MNKSTVSSKNMNLPNIMNGRAIFTTKNMIIAILVVLLIFSFLGINILGLIGLILQSVVNLIRPIFDSILGWVFYYIGAAVNVSADVVGDVARTGINIAEGTAHSVGNILQNEDNVGEPLPTQTAFYKKLFETTPIEEQETPYTVYRDDIQPIASDMGERISNAMDIAEQMTKDISGPISVNLATVSPSFETVDNSDMSTENDLDKVIASEFRPTVPSVSPSPSWCLVGQFGGKRSCMSLEENEICESGQTYTTESDCLQLQLANSNRVVSKKAEPKIEKIIVKKTVQKPEQVVYKQNWGIPPPRPPPAALSPIMGQIPTQNPYISKTYGSYVSTPLHSTLPNPYYASNKYRMTPGTPNVTYTGPRPGLYLQK
jgi:hypothetical protein